MKRCVYPLGNMTYFRSSLSFSSLTQFYRRHEYLPLCLLASLVAVLGDCSITYAESMGGFYDTKCVVLAAINFVFLCTCFQYLYVLRARRIMTKRKKRNLMEGM